MQVNVHQNNSYNYIKGSFDDNSTYYTTTILSFIRTITNILNYFKTSYTLDSRPSESCMIFLMGVVQKLNTKFE